MPVRLAMFADLERGDHLAQIVGHRRTQGDDPHGELVNLGLERIEALVARHHLIGQGLIAAHQRIERFGDGDLGKPAHLGDKPAQAGDVLVEGLDGMLGHHPYLPVI
jgi:hypothetical protein